MNAQPKHLQSRLAGGARGRLVPGSWLWALGAIALCACNAVLGIEQATLDTSITGGHGAQGGHTGTGGTGPECQSPDDCNDGNPCTTDDCQDGKCSNVNVPNGPADAALQTAGDCKQIMCTNGTQHPQADDTDLPVDGNDCTADLCTSGVASNPAEPTDTACTQNGGKVCFQGQCVECHTNQQCTAPKTCGGGGTPLVCGCTPTACDSLTCGFATDNKCGGGTLNCNNNAQDGYETDIDCGGPQPPAGTCAVLCQNGKHCLVNSDCASANCAQPCGLCETASCP